MKLMELTGVKKFQDLNTESLTKVFQDVTGYKLIGTGSFANVFKHPTKNEVLRLWIHDTAYNDFVEYAIKHQSNPYMPKILSPVKKLSSFHKRLESFPDKIMYVRTELLTPIKPSDVGTKNNLGEVFQDCYRFFGSVDPKNYRRPNDWTVRQEDDYYDVIEKHWPKTKLIPDEVIDLFATYIDILNTIKDSLHDMHEENVMMRGNQIVITDPISRDEAPRDILDSASKLISGRKK